MSKTILVVDDQPMIREMIIEAAVSRGIKGFEAANGQQALELLTTHQVDLIITDFQMPIMDGLRLLITLRRQPAYRDLPIIMMSGETTDIHHVSLRSGATAFIQKPFNLPELLDCVQQLLQLGA